MYQAKKEENAVDQTPVSESMIPLKLCLTFDPPQIGIVYRKTKVDKKKHIYIIQLNSLILLGDAEKITQQLYEKHAAYLSQKKIRPQQVDRDHQICKLVQNILLFIEQKLMDYEEEEHNEQDEEYGEGHLDDEFDMGH